MDSKEREDKVQRLLQDQIDHARTINDAIGKCECEADCGYHKIYLSHQELTTVLLEELEVLYLKSIDAKFYLSDFRFLAQEVVSGILNEIDSKEYNKTYNNAVRTSEDRNGDSYKRGGISI